MNAQTFLDNFGHIANAPNGVERLRELVFYFAITGGLSSQEDGDSDVAAIREETLRARRSYFEENNVRRAQRKNAELRQTVADVPPWWTLIPAGDLVHLINGRAFKPSDWQSTGLPIIRIQNLNNPNAPFNYYEGELMEGHKVSTGDMLLSWSGTPGTSFGAFIWNRGEAALNQHIFKVIIYCGGIDKQYLKMAINACLEALIGSARGGVGLKHVTKGQIEALQIPLPPLEEQKRIVARVDELMALCDKLEALQQKREKLCELTRTTALSALVNAQNQSELLNAWNRTQHNMTVLFDTSETVDELRNAIMSMAVRGRLTARTSSNAQDLLENCREYKESLVKTEKVKRLKPFKKLSNYPFEIPQNWTWARFSEIGFFGRGISKHRPRNDTRLFLDGKYPFIQTGDVAHSVGKGIQVFSKKYSEFGLQQSKLWPPGTLCITIAANIADSAILKIEACFPDSVVGFIPFEIVDNVEYFDFFVRTAKSDLTKFAPATAQKNINLGILEEVAIPLPPREEMEEIVQKSTELLKFCDFLESRLSNVKSTAALLAASAVAAITGTQIEEQEKMKAPKMALVSALKVGASPKPKDQAPLTSLLTKNEGELSAKTLWSHSGLKIEEFYQQLKTEMANGWIIEPEKAVMREVTAN